MYMCICNMYVEYSISGSFMVIVLSSVCLIFYIEVNTPLVQFRGLFLKIETSNQGRRKNKNFCIF